ncbi:MAG: glutamate 5-kinase [Acidimicrobiia bacterium]
MTSAAARTVVIKVGTSSLTDHGGALLDDGLDKLGGDVASAHQAGWSVVLVVSGAISAGMPALRLDTRPTDVGMLQALAAVGQPRLMQRLIAIFEDHDLVGGQVLLTSSDFGQRSQYLHARETLQRLLELGVVPIINENDTVADDEIRFGDNDRIAALVASMVQAGLLLMLTDTAGLFTADPRHHENASLIEEITEVDAEVERAAGGAGTARGSGGMASKLAAAKIAAWSGIRSVIAAATRDDVVVDALRGENVGTAFAARAECLSSRKVWIAFARPARGRVVVDDGAKHALLAQGSSLLAAGVLRVEGDFNAGDAVEVVDLEGHPVAKGLVAAAAAAVADQAGRRTSELPAGASAAVIHRDDLVVLPG